MKALTISQPYASFILDGLKWVENRTWGTQYRGRLAIHAGLDRKRLRHYCPRLPYQTVVGKGMDDLYPRGVVLGTVRLAACFTLAELQQFQRERPTVRIPGSARWPRHLLRHPHAEGPWCWILEDLDKFPTPIPATGKQGLWEWDEAPTWTGR